jgi:starch synthase
MPLSILFVASECAPFAKAGGLGDVVGALPLALRALGHDVRVVLPRYGTISTQGMMPIQGPLGVPIGFGEAWCGVLESRLPKSDVPVYFLEHSELFGSRRYLYDPPNGFSGDNLGRYTLLSRGALQLCKKLNWHPDVFHVHDWPSSLIPMYLNTVEANGPLAMSASVLTIHNIAHPGKFPGSQFPVTQLPSWVNRTDGVEDHGALNLLKGGLYHSTKLNAVSPRYAEEIKTREEGFGLDHVLRFRAADLVGILNGIDEDVWNPATDTALPAHFNADDLSGKAICKQRLQLEMGLAQNPRAPLIGVVTRLGHQKGTDVIADALGHILAMGAQVVVLGSGDSKTESFLRRVSESGTDMFRAFLGFNEALAHRIEAASDLFLMPSRFEPCGLNQMYSQRYGTLPIVRATGGLEDTVENYNPRTGEGTGFKLQDLSVASLVETVRWAIETYHLKQEHFTQMQQRAMRKPQGWDIAAQHYVELYHWALHARRG